MGSPLIIPTAGHDNGRHSQNGTGPASAPTKYPVGLERLPQLLDELDAMRLQLEAMGADILDLLEGAERAMEFASIRVEQARVREGRRVRRRGRKT
jgi:hypothetical protein